MWRVVQVVGLALSFGNPSDVLAAVVDVAFMVVQGLGACDGALVGAAEDPHALFFGRPPPPSLVSCS